MNEKIILFIIGLLVGAVISTGAFYVYTTTSNTCNNNQTTRLLMVCFHHPLVPATIQSPVPKLGQCSCRS